MVGETICILLFFKLQSLYGILGSIFYNWLHNACHAVAFFHTSVGLMGGLDRLNENSAESNNTVVLPRRHITARNHASRPECHLGITLPIAGGSARHGTARLGSARLSPSPSLRVGVAFRNGRR